MSTSDEDRYHIDRVRGRIESEDALAAFDRLMSWAGEKRGLFIYPLSRGAFSAIHLATRPIARKYADCAFGFTGARTHLRWHFRKPCFDSGLFRSADVEAAFVCDVKPTEGEIATNIHDLAEAGTIIDFVTSHLTAAHSARPVR